MMIEFDKFVLANGLRVIVHRDPSTPIVAMNILYDVGARDENPDRTGFAHLFEHLMFGGSVNIPRYDEHLEKAGGENNAFTNNDYTDYYLTIPSHNLETAFWLESDRMLGLAFSEKSFDVQRGVVVEEFKQNYLNQPYGDAWLLLRQLAYKVHPYQWPTIGKKPEHIEQASMQEVREFYKKFYHPANAILSVAGDVDVDQIGKLCEKWFAPIPAGKRHNRKLPQEPVQTEPRQLAVERDVPFDALLKAWHMGPRSSKEYYAADALSDVLSSGKSGRLYQQLVKNKQIFSQIDAYISGDHDPGVFIVNGKLMKGVPYEKAEAALNAELEKIKTTSPAERELQKVKNRFESMMEFNKMQASAKALNLNYFELLGDAGLINNLGDDFNSVSADDISQAAARILCDQNCSTLRYIPSNGNNIKAGING